MSISDTFLPLPFLESYILASTDDQRRQALTTQLVPNSAESAYATAVHELNSNNIPAAEKQLAQLEGIAAAFKTANGYEDGNLRTVVTALKHRILVAKASNATGIKELADFYVAPPLNLARFDHPKHTNPLPTANAGTTSSSPSYPSKLDQELIDPKKVMKTSIADYGGPENLEPEALGALAFYIKEHLPSLGKSPDTLNAIHRVLNRSASLLAFQDPADGKNLLPGLLQKLWTDYPDSKFQFLSQFGDELTLAELDGFSDKFPALWNDADFVQIYMRKLMPEIDTEETFATSLPVWTEGIAKVSQKIAAGPLLGIKLRIDLEYLDRVRKEEGKGEDFAKFLEYIKVPKRSPVGNYLLYEKYQNSPEYRKRGQVEIEARDYNSVLDPTFFPPLSDTEEEALIKEYVEAYFLKELAANKDITKDGWKVFADYLENAWLRNVHALVVLHRTPSPDVSKLTQFLHDPISDLTSRVDLEFHRFKNPPRKEAKSITIVAKNTPSIQLNVFRINALQFYKSRLEANESIDDAALVALDLGGLVPNATKQLDFTSLGQLRIHEVEVNLTDDLLYPGESKAEQDVGGIWVVEFIGKSKRIRAVVRRGGTLGYLQRLTGGGVLISMIDGRGKRIKDAAAKIWLSGRIYEADDQGDFAVPFSRDAKETTLLLISPSRNLAVPRSFSHPSESYSLQAAFVLNRESIVKGNKATVLIRPSILLNGTKEVGLHVVEDSTLSVATMDGQSVETVKNVEGFLKTAEGEGPEKSYDFVVPENLRSLTFTLTAKIRIISQNRVDTFTTSQSFSLNAIDATTDLHSTYLRRLDSGDWQLFCLGKTGEPREGEILSVRLKSKYVSRPVTVTLATDAQGKIDLGKCADVDLIEVLSGTMGSRVWNLVPSLAEEEGPITVSVSEAVSVSLSKPVKAQEVRLVKLSSPSGATVANMTQTVKLVDGGHVAVLEGLKAGCYQFEAAGSGSVDIRVVATAKEADLGDWADQAVVDGREVYPRDSAVATPLRIAKMAVKANALELSLQNISESTRVHVVVSNFAPFDVSAGTFSLPKESLLGGTSLENEGNSFTASEQLPDELGYVMSRKTKGKELGTLLRKPGVLLSTWKLRSTSLQTNKLDAPPAKPSAPKMLKKKAMMKEQAEEVSYDAKVSSEYYRAPGGVMAMADQRMAFGAVGYGSGAGPIGGMRRNAGYISDTIGSPSSEDWANYDFLSQPGSLVISVKPNGQGALSIPITACRTPRMVQVAVTDGAFTAMRTAEIPAEDPKTVSSRDISLRPAWKAEEHFIEHNQISLLASGESLLVGATSSASIVSTVAKLFELAETLCENFSEKEHYSTFRFVTRWNSMARQEKLAMYGEYSCHELDLFIKSKDVEFFEQVVKPFLSCKAAKEPIDYFCLGDVERCRTYLANPERFAKLNVAEKLLLASLVGGESEAAVHRWLLDDVRKKDTRPGAAAEKARFREKLFKIVMASSGDDSGLPPPEPEPAMAGAAAADMAPPPPPPAVMMSTGMAFGAPAPAPMMMAAAPMSLMAAMPVAAAPPAPMPMQQAMRSRGAPAAMNRRDMGLRNEAREKAASGEGLYEPLEATSEFGERQWWKRSKNETPCLVESNGFWKDWVKSKDRSLFLSENFGEALKGRFTEAIVAMSLMTIAFGDISGRDYEMAGSTSDPTSLTINAKQPLIAFHKGFKESPQKLLPSILVSQKYYDPAQRQYFDEEVGENVDRYLEPENGDKLAPSRVYGCQITLTNTSALQHLVTVLFQIPAGSIPLQNSVATKSQTISLQPFQTTLLDFSFYFPRSGKFAHFPVHVSDRRQNVVAYGTPVTLEVERPQTDAVTEDVKRQFWWVASEGTTAELLAWLADEKNTYDNGTLSPLLWRLKDAAVFRQVVDTIRARGVFDLQVWSYSLLHKQEREIREWMAATNWVTNTTLPYARGPLLETDLFDQGRAELVEYWPLVNARVHKIADRPRVNNREAIATFSSIARYLFHKPLASQSGADRLYLVCLLLLQDRNIEARAIFKDLVVDVESGRLSMDQQIQFDYAQAWLAFLDDSPSNNLQVARQMAEKYNDYPVPHWKHLFGEVGRAVRDFDALRNGLKDLPASEAGEPLEEAGEEASAAAQGARESRMASRTRKEPRLEFKYDAQAAKLRIAHANLDSVTVGYHPLDLEIEFSSRPFAVIQTGDGAETSSGSSNPALFVWPTESSNVTLPAGEEETTIDLPATLRNQNVVIDLAAKGGEIVRSRVAGQSSMVVQVLDKSGMVQVLAPSSSGLKPLASTYVKVYSRLNDKQIVFYKDGYTDLLGRFDYASLSNTSVLQRSEKFAIFVADDKLGSIVKEGGVPKT